MKIYRQNKQIIPLYHVIISPVIPTLISFPLPTFPTVAPSPVHAYPLFWRMRDICRVSCNCVCTQTHFIIITTLSSFTTTTNQQQHCYRGGPGGKDIHDTKTSDTEHITNTTQDICGSYTKLATHYTLFVFDSLDGTKIDSRARGKTQVSRQGQQRQWHKGGHL